MKLRAKVGCPESDTGPIIRLGLLQGLPQYFLEPFRELYLKVRKNSRDVPSARPGVPRTSKLAGKTEAVQPVLTWNMLCRAQVVMYGY